MVLDILEYPDPRLRKTAATVPVVTADIRKLVRDMVETMYAAPGVGLSATQVDVHKRELRPRRSPVTIEECPGLGDEPIPVLFGDVVVDHMVLGPSNETSSADATR